MPDRTKLFAAAHALKSREDSLEQWGASCQSTSCAADNAYRAGWDAAVQWAAELFFTPLPNDLPITASDDLNLCGPSTVHDEETRERFNKILAEEIERARADKEQADD
jgi:DNA recombination-dependent growth factor C